MSKYLNVSCAFHNNQIITHFCYTSLIHLYLEQCMLPLCKVCISIHKKQHLNMEQKANIREVLPILDKVTTLLRKQIKTEIQIQKDELRRKNQLIQKKMRVNQENNQTLIRSIQNQREQLLSMINDRFHSILEQLKKHLDSKYQYLYETKSKFDEIQSCLNLVEESFYKGKVMRSLIMWQSQEINKMGIDLQKRLQTELLIPDRVKFFKIENKNQILNKLIDDKSLLDTNNNNSENSQLMQYLNSLGKIVPKDLTNISGSAQKKSENRKSVSKLKNSGISLTEVSGTKIDGFKIMSGNLKTPERTLHSNLTTVRNQILFDTSKNPISFLNRQQPQRIKRKSQESSLDN